MRALPGKSSDSLGILPLHANEQHAMPEFGLKRHRFDVGGEFDLALKPAIGDFHMNLPASGFQATIAPFAADAHESAVLGQFDVIGLHAGELEFDEPTIARTVDIGRRPPIRFALLGFLL
jgi:hypothetical protein